MFSALTNVRLLLVVWQLQGYLHYMRSVRCMHIANLFPFNTLRCMLARLTAIDRRLKPLL